MRRILSFAVALCELGQQRTDNELRRRRLQVFVGRRSRKPKVGARGASGVRRNAHVRQHRGNHHEHAWHEPAAPALLHAGRKNGNLPAADVLRNV